MTNNNSSGRIIRTIIVILCIINIVFLVIASRRGSLRAGGAQSRLSGSTETAATASTADEYASTREEAAAGASETGQNKEQPTAAEPTITLSKNLPDLTQDDLDDLVPVLKKADAISADDGNGNDITDDIEAVPTADLDDLGHFTVRFSVTTDDDKTARASADVTVPITKPILELTEYSTELNRNDRFQSLDYVETSVDEDGSDLSRVIRVNGDVDTSQAGNYDVTYTIQSAIDNAAAQKTLRVTVQ